MHTLRAWLVGLLIVAVSGGVASAAEKEPTQQVVGNGIQTGTGVVSGSGALVTKIVWANTGASAVVVSLYDTDNLGGTSNANGAFEYESPASTGANIVFDPPLKFTRGVTMVASAMSGVTIYGQTP